MRAHGGENRLPPTVWVISTAWVLASAADSFLLFTLFWVAGPEGWSGVEVAVVVVALRAPTVAGGVLGGRGVDRFGGRPLFLLDSGGRSVLMLVLAAVGWSGNLPLVAVFSAGALAGGLSPLSYAGARCLVPLVVDPQTLPRANAALSLGDQLQLVVSAALVGPVLEMLGPGRGMLLPAAMLACATALIMRLPRELSAAGPRLRSADGLPRSTRSAENSPWRAPRVLALVGLSVVYYLAYGPFEPASAPYVRDQLGGDSGTYGLLWALFGIGAIASLPLAPRLARGRPGLVNAVGAAAWGIVMLPLAFIGHVWLAAAMFVAGGVIWGPYSTVETTALHRWTHPSQHGRVFGIQRALLLTASPVGAAIGAAALDYLAPRAILAASCGACLAGGLLAVCLADLRRSTSSDRLAEAQGSECRHGDSSDVPCRRRARARLGGGRRVEPRPS